MNKTKVVALLAGLTLIGSSTLVQAYQISPNPNPASGVISVTTLDAENAVAFENNGSLRINNGGLLSNNSSGILNNNSSGTMSITTIGTLNNSGFLNNAGYISNGGTINNSYIFNNTGLIDFSNVTSGTLNNYNTVINYGSFVALAGGIVNNYNTFTNSSVGSGWIDNMNNYNTFVNSGNFFFGVLHNLGTVTNIVGADSGAGGIVNFGTLNNLGDFQLDASGVSTNFGILNNSGTLGGPGGPVLTNSGTINNSGVLHVQILHNTETLNNLGGNLGAMSLDNSGTLFNSGTISSIGTYIQTAGHTINNGTMTKDSFDFQGGTLSGTGTMNGDVTIESGASVNPGNSPGTMTINGNLNSSGIFVFQIAGLGTGLFDVLGINGNANFTGGNIQFDFINGFSAAAGNFWDFMTAQTITGWDTLNFNFNGLGDGLGWNFTQLDTGGERLWITSTSVVSPVPEPHTYAMLLAGIGLIGFIARRKNRNGAMNFA